MMSEELKVGANCPARILIADERHCERLAEYSVALGRAVRLGDEDLRRGGYRGRDLPPPPVPLGGIAHHPLNGKG